MSYIPLPPGFALIGYDEAQWLYSQALEMESIVEIGSFQGFSTHALLTGCKGLVYAVDHFQGSSDPLDATHKWCGKPAFLKNVGHFPNLRLLEMDSIEASKRFLDKSIDMVFIDAGHLYEEISADLKAWLPKVKKLICGHDVWMAGVTRALEETFKYWTVPIGSMWEVRL